MSLEMRLGAVTNLNYISRNFLQLVDGTANWVNEVVTVGHMDGAFRSVSVADALFYMV